MSVNKDAQYREEFVELAHEKEISPINALYLYIYIAGRKKGEDIARNLEDEIISFGSELDIYKKLSDDRDRELTLLKKELEDAKTRTTEDYLSLCRINNDFNAENKQLRQFVNEAVIIIRAKDFTNAEEFLKEAELILNGRGL